MKKIYTFIIFAIIFGLISGAISSLIITKISSPSEEDLIKEFYDVETATKVSPHHLRKHINDEDFILVDVRSEEEYIKEHIIGAINIPAYKDKEHSDYGAVERITNSFKEIREANPEKDIIVYCYSGPCMSGSKVGKILADRGIYVKQLGIGWNEWRYDWENWNHEHEWEETNVEDYIISGNESGKANVGYYEGTCGIDDSISC